MSGKETTDAIVLADAAATEAAGVVLTQALDARAGAVVFLEGDLGAGKTTLVRGLLRALGVAGPVRSPTYTLVEPYAIGTRSVVHMDLYRLADPHEWWTLGLDAYPPDQTLWLVEWPQRAQGLLPAPTLVLRLAVRGSARTLEVHGEAGLADSVRAGLQALS
ncbi:tRNA (adenosine(37)-N6)-threonylcarbamoyltransferase complex ATPase subunit type 1 TsaE [Sinimarinibacterium thermocellulolyticum]|uniref:tRNA threonylcarbamoyladenosine biosynthesis protein TsaE n=1 Tax=Sinimarinibacterium thermocellulolyticum TaxID=3170016 RepID=A0ABV2A9W9_9GAMM